MADYVLDPGEHVAARIGRHWADLIGVVAGSVAIAVVALAAVYLYARFPEELPFLTPALVMLAAALMLGIAGLMLATALYVYKHNYLLITNFHLIKVQQSGLFARQTAALVLGNIEDVKGSRRGILATVLNFGDMEVQTAGASENFIFRNAPNPQLAADRLLQYKAEFKLAHPEVHH
jgi:hypothetical protein